MSTNKLKNDSLPENLPSESQNDCSKDSTNETQTKNVDPFAKSSRVGRSPIRPRISSTSSATSTNADEKEPETLSDTESLTGKRKRPQENKAEMLIEILGKMQNQIQKLDKIVKDYYKPKTELQEITARLVFQAERIHSKNVNEWLQNQTEGNKDGEIMSLQKENRKLMRRIASLEVERELESQNLIKSTNLARCEECKKEELKEELRRKCREDNSYHCYQSITEEMWGTEPFTMLESNVDQIWEVPENYDLILPCNSELQGCSRQISRAINRIGGKEHLLNQKKVKGQMATLVHQLGFPDQDGNIQFKTRNMYYPIFTNENDIDKFHEEDMFNALNCVKLCAENTNNTVAIPEIGGPTGEILKRMAQFLFANTKTELALCRERNSTIALTNKTASSDRTSQKTTRPFKEDAVLVKMEGKTYADLLRTVKKEVSPDDIGVNIKTVRKTKNGELLLTVPHGVGAAEVLKAEIMRKVPGAVPTFLNKKKTLHIRDLDEITTVEDVRKSITDTIKVDAEDLNIRAIRPTMSGRQNVTVILPAVKADELIDKGRIKIGWVNCKITERKPESKCTRCWEYTHQKRDCVGPDRSNLCMKCGKEGHKANICKDQPFCLSCKVEGHQTSSYKCPSRQSKTKK